MGPADQMIPKLRTGESARFATHHRHKAWRVWLMTHEPFLLVRRSSEKNIAVETRERPEKLKGEKHLARSGERDLFRLTGCS